MTGLQSHPPRPPVHQLDEVQAKDVNRSDGAGNLHAKEHVTEPALPAAGPSIALNDVRKSITCNVCQQLMASSLVLSCGHQYCGSCLFDYLGSKPSCPNCQVPLRAIPVRCIALDAVIEAFLPQLPKHEVEAYYARQEEGKSAANKVNKMFWWLQPSMPPSNPNGMAAAQGASPYGLQGPMAAANGKHMPSPFMPQASAANAGFNQHGGGLPAGPSHGHYRRASHAGGMSNQQSGGLPPRSGPRSNSFSAGGAPPALLSQQQQHVAMGMPSHAYSAAASLPSSDLDLLANTLQQQAQQYATATVLDQMWPMMVQQQRLQQQGFAGVRDPLSSGSAGEHYGNSPPTNGGYDQSQQLQQLLHGLYFA